MVDQNVSQMKDDKTQWCFDLTNYNASARHSFVAYDWCDK